MDDPLFNIYHILLIAKLLSYNNKIIIPFQLIYNLHINN